MMGICKGIRFPSSQRATIGWIGTARLGGTLQKLFFLFRVLLMKFRGVLF